MTGKPNPFPASEYALLGFLYSGPSHGYDLHKKLKEPAGIGLIWGVKIANMYAQLEKLAIKGLINGHVIANDQRPARMEYSLTEAGKTEFLDWLFRVVEHPRDFRHDFMTKLHFLWKYFPDKLEDVIDNQLAKCEKWSKETARKEASLSTPGTFENLTFHFRLSQIQSMVDWLKWTKTQLSSIQNLRGEE
jgi:DNA-binding PadR family transcriptional regulator